MTKVTIDLSDDEVSLLRHYSELPVRNSGARPHITDVVCDKIIDELPDPETEMVDKVSWAMFQSTYAYITPEQQKWVDEVIDIVRSAPVFRRDQR